MQSRSSGLAAFHYPNYTWYWISQVTTNVGTWMQQVATGWLVLQITDSPAYLGFNAAFQAVPILVFSLVGGVVADRFDRYKLMVWAYV
ncbi:MAG: MFS transporter, partial [Chloroflexota bacterium]